MSSHSESAILLAAAMTALTFTACGNDEQAEPGTIINGPRIIATITDTPASRTAVDGTPDGTGVVGIVWTADDDLGVFTSATDSQVKYCLMPGSAVDKTAVFTPSGSAVVTGVPRYAYYPYSDINGGRAVTNLTGTVPSQQVMNAGSIAGDYKYGSANGSGSTESGYRFEFRHLFSLVKVDVDATGTELTDDVVKSVEFIVTRGENPVNIAGDFSFNAVRGSWTFGQNLTNTLNMTWSGQVSLSGPLTGYISVFPTIQTGDALTFKVTTDKHIASFTVTSKVSFAAENIYNFPLDLSRFTTEEFGWTLTDSEGNPIGPVDPLNPLTGTFTCATYNVDGLPSIINSDGPGSNGTTLLGQTINTRNNWDFFGVSENFEYNSQLVSALSNFSHGTYRGSVGIGQAFGSKADTDGLNFFWKKSGVTVTGETYIEFNDVEGDLYHGANTCIKKGFRYYMVTLESGVELDVYITHMNTYSGSSIDESNGYVRAVHNQMRQVAAYIKEHQNNRPVIFMGDTNCRYTRHKIKELLIDAINSDENLEIVDPWISLAWNNDFSSVGGDTYPQYGGKSLMVSDATGTNADTDIIISESDGGLQKGEVVDKIFYINNKNSRTQIKANSYLRDVSFKKADGTPLADHYPIVVEFTYTTAR